MCRKRIGRELFLTQSRRVAENAEVRQEAVLIGYPCEFFGSDTDGEKTFEEFYTATDEKDEMTFVNLGVVKNAKRRPVSEVEAIFADLHRIFDREGATKDDVVEALKEYLPDFSHISKGKSLDGRM